MEEVETTLLIQKEYKAEFVKAVEVLGGGKAHIITMIEKDEMPGWLEVKIEASGFTLFFIGQSYMLNQQMKDDRRHRDLREKMLEESK
jgi:hypothetical protein